MLSATSTALYGLRVAASARSGLTTVSKNARVRSGFFSFFMGPSEASIASQFFQPALFRVLGTGFSFFPCLDSAPRLAELRPDAFKS